ncbi:hypothetical protein H5410_004785 [Solanum commersonii]|uniref:Uncharacterized protein n=1 Tax=Solanum commersonii TaxID=4109 RepID=A0A9J6A673_SOLCO|nr:hypothetical protein H5410_004785 [Solanum commersonii]
MDDWDKSWLGDECPLCYICGRQYIHWNGCPKSYSLPPNPYYDSSIICDVSRGDEVENAKQEAHNVNSLMEYALDAIQLEIIDLEIAAQQRESYEKAEIVSQFWLQEQTQLIKFHESIHDGLTYMISQLIEGRVELIQDIDQFDSDIHDLDAHLNKMIKASDDQLVEKKEEF